MQRNQSYLSKIKIPSVFEHAWEENLIKKRKTSKSKLSLQLYSCLHGVCHLVSLSRISLNVHIFNKHISNHFNNKWLVVCLLKGPFLIRHISTSSVPFFFVLLAPHIIATLDFQETFYELRTLFMLLFLL